MVEYGNGVGQVSGQGGGGGLGGGPVDLGARVSGFVQDSAATISALPPEQLLLIVVAIIAGLFILRRAF